MCESCGEAKPLEMHHLTYRHDPYNEGIPSPIFGHESPSDLQALCRNCHQSAHRDLNGDYWQDPEEMDDYWSSYWSDGE